MDKSNENLEDQTSHLVSSPLLSSSRTPATSYQHQSNVEKPKVLKLWALMKRLVLVELILAVFCLIFGSACTGTSYANIYYFPSICIDGSGVWVGILCMVTACVGIGALKLPTGQRGMLIAHFILLLMSTIGCLVLIIISSIWIADLNHFIFYHQRVTVWPEYVTSVAIALLAFNIILLITSVILCKFK